MTAPSATTMRSVQRALDLLNVLQTYQHPVRLSDLARHADLHIATAQRLLNVLVDNGFATRYASGYTAGPAALSIAHAYLVASPLNMIAIALAARSRGTRLVAMVEPMEKNTPWASPVSTRATTRAA